MKFHHSIIRSTFYCTLLSLVFLGHSFAQQDSAKKIMPSVMMLLNSEPSKVRVDAVFFAQTHVLEAQQENFGLVSDREALLKVHVLGPPDMASPNIVAVLKVGNQSQRFTLTGPSVLPTFIPKRPGRVQHSVSDTFTTVIPAEWIQPGLSITIEGAEEEFQLSQIDVGAPTEVIMTMFDVHFFNLNPGDYPAGFAQELEAKWPVANLKIRRTPNIVFPQLVIPARAGAPVVRVNSREDYVAQTGISFDGEQGAAAQWNGALKRAAGTRGRVSLYYTNIYGVPSGGQAGGFGGVGNGRNVGILHHELGHALSLPHWGNNASYPYKGDMLGIPAPNIFRGTHAGPTWAFDLPSRTFIPPTVQTNAVSGNSVVGTYKADPMQGGGQGDQEQGFILRHFSDFSVNRMRNYLQGHVVKWNSVLNRFAAWNQTAGDYTNTVNNNGVEYPVQRNVEVISVMAAVSAASREGISNVSVNMVYPPIGPYTTGLIDLFDPSIAADRARADAVYCPTQGCDVSVRVTQGGNTKSYMLAAHLDPTVSATTRDALITRAVNLPAEQGSVTNIDLLLTPDAEINGLPNPPTVLASWSVQ